MKMIPMFLKELEQKAQITRKMLSRVPNDKFDWQPHAKSMTIRQLTTHITELPEWIPLAINTDELDFAKNPYKPELLNNIDELLATLEKNLALARASLEQADEEILNKPWVLRNGGYIIMTYTKAEVIRVALNQTTHHRAQLGVYLRLLNIPIPGSYGPSADELEFAAAMEQA
ncbi:DinB family protein [Mucilaginibacter sp. E4BP6]|uniref:DinB family protein n=1 Tax=Mucilaginibacter sp. E4BP6 TaxID=2723089 RepID=UPI0015CE0BD6|nr:DinB family protein [Mucilaginibacter sp. E4BP6]NYE67445.1 putative damage-inducible protein DinB [Mucilaginibacter sp. E4BP6]